MGSPFIINMIFILSSIFLKNISHLLLIFMQKNTRKIRVFFEFLIISKNTFSLYSLLFKIFDFNDEFEIKDFIFKTFKITENESEIFLEDVKYFNDKCKHLDGFFNVYNNIGICIINANSCDVQATIYHELSHYIQLVGNIRTVKKFNVDKEKLEDNEKFKQLKALDITFQDLNYYFSSSEFVPHIDDLIVGLWNTFQEFYNTKNDIDPLLNFFING